MMASWSARRRVAPRLTTFVHTVYRVVAAPARSAASTSRLFGRTPRRRQGRTGAPARRLDQSCYGPTRADIGTSVALSARRAGGRRNCGRRTDSVKESHAPYGPSFFEAYGLIRGRATGVPIVFTALPAPRGAMFEPLVALLTTGRQRAITSIVLTGDYLSQNRSPLAPRLFSGGAGTALSRPRNTDPVACAPVEGPSLVIQMRFLTTHAVRRGGRRTPGGRRPERGACVRRRLSPAARPPAGYSIIPNRTMSRIMAATTSTPANSTRHRRLRSARGVCAKTQTSTATAPQTPRNIPPGVKKMALEPYIGISPSRKRVRL